MKTEEELRFGVIGAGMIAEYHVQAMRESEGVRAVAICETNAERRESFAAKHGLRPYERVEDLLADSGVNAVSIATPSGLHAEVAIPAARAGKHILCEKPLETLPSRAQSIIDACREGGRILAPVFQYRYGNGARLIREAVEAGRFGKLLFASARVKWFRPQSYYDSGAWRGTWKLDGGGCLMNQSIHAVDLMIHFSGGVPAQVFGAAATRTHAIEVEDNAAALVRFDNGVIGTIEASTSCEPGFPLEVSVSGEKGTAVLTGDGISAWTFKDSHPLDARAASAASGTGNAASDPKAISTAGHVRILGNMLRAARGDRSGLIDPLEARYPLDVICGVYESNALGRPTPLPWRP